MLIGTFDNWSLQQGWMLMKEVESKDFNGRVKCSRVYVTPAGDVVTVVHDGGQVRLYSKGPERVTMGGFV